MASFKDLEDNFKSYIIQEQSDAHNIKSVNVAKYNNIKIWINMSRYLQPPFFVRISISEAAFSISDCTKLCGGLGYEERYVYKWFTRIGNKDKLSELWANAMSERIDVMPNNKNDRTN